METREALSFTNIRAYAAWTFIVIFFGTPAIGAFLYLMWLWVSVLLLGRSDTCPAQTLC